MRAEPMSPHLRTDLARSLLRAAALLEARARFARGDIDREELRGREDGVHRPAAPTSPSAAEGG
jgi:hypothetical protein